MSLARPSDREAVPAWLALARAAASEASPDRSGDAAGGWPELAASVGRLRGSALAEAAALIGLPVGVLGERSPDSCHGVRSTSFGSAATRRPLRVVDLSSLWAGPLCAAILGAAGAQVTKVEASGRPDGARRGSPELFGRLNGDKALVSLDLAAPGGRLALAELVARADVVVESSRPRALEQLGIVAATERAGADGPHVWVSITGHGRSSPRVAFGDDAAVAGGLVVATPGGPRFCGDAAADPLAGLTAAAAALEALAAGERVLVDVALSGVAASIAVDLGFPGS